MFGAIPDLPPSLTPIPPIRIVKNSRSSHRVQRSSSIRWALLTGEYPPQPGGVADYSRLVALGLAEAGDTVTVYAPPSAGSVAAIPGVELRRLPDHFGPRGLLALDRELSRNRPDRILVQYVPHAYGYKAMNLPFAVWVARRAARFAPVWIMFHEVMTPIAPGQPPSEAVLGRVTRQMARVLARAADRIFVSIPAWDGLFRSIGVAGLESEWTPVPSNVPDAAGPEDIAAIRNRFAPSPNGIIIGYFGSFGSMNGSLLKRPLAELLGQSPERIGLLVGRNGSAFRDRFAAEYPALDGRVFATGELAAGEVSAHLSACDLLLQPYPDGVSSRRGSVMAGLALGVPTLTNRGFLSEPVWGTESAGVSVAPSPEAAPLVAAAEELLALPAVERFSRGRSTAAWYRSRFAIGHTIAKLRSPRP